MIASPLQEMWGNVVDHDQAASPFLLDWYQRRGFVLSGPYGECIAGAVRKITLRL